MKTDSPTPPAPAAVCERLQLLYDHILDDDCLKDAIALISQGEKEREKLRADLDSTDNKHFDSVNQIIDLRAQLAAATERVKQLEDALKQLIKAGTKFTIGCNCQPASADDVFADELERARAARAQPTPESK